MTRVELHVELAVGAHAEFCDGFLLEWSEARVLKIDGCPHHREGYRQNQAVHSNRRPAGECEDKRARGRALDREQGRVGYDLSSELFRETRNDQIVATA